MKRGHLYVKIDVRDGSGSTNVPKVHSMKYQEVVDRIVNLNDGIKAFWSKADGWAPIEVAGLLTKSRLDWQVSLSRCLQKWEHDPPTELYDGELILAWVNIGSLVEGSMMLFLSVWYKDYKQNIDDEIKKNPKLKFKKPDELRLQILREFFNKYVWHDGIEDFDWNTWVENIQNRRNAIHAFKHRDIGDFKELRRSVKIYLRFLRYINRRLIYPDDIYEPREE